MNGNKGVYVEHINPHDFIQDKRLVTELTQLNDTSHYAIVQAILRAGFLQR